MTDENLKPCPFCDNTPYYCGYGNDKQQIGCETCGIEFSGSREVWNKWNTRAQEPTGDAVEALKEHLSKSCNDSFGKVRNGLDERIDRSDAISALEEIAIYLNKTRNLCKAALQTPATGNTSEGVDVEGRADKITQTLFDKTDGIKLTDKEIIDWAKPNMMMLLNDELKSDFPLFMSKLLLEIIQTRKGLLSGKIPDGFALVPLRPTPEMIEAALKCSMKFTYEIPIMMVYEAMIAAAPSTNKEETK